MQIKPGGIVTTKSGHGRGEVLGVTETKGGELVKVRWKMAGAEWISRIKAEDLVKVDEAKGVLVGTIK